MRYILFLLLPVLLQAQAITNNYLNTRCGVQTAGQTYILITGPAAYPLCLAKGLTLKVTMVNGQATLDVDTSKLPPQSTVYPKMQSSKIVFQNDLPIGTTVYNYTLTKTPAGWILDLGFSSPSLEKTHKL